MPLAITAVVSLLLGMANHESPGAILTPLAAQTQQDSPQTNPPPETPKTGQEENQPAPPTTPPQNSPAPAPSQAEEQKQTPTESSKPAPKKVPTTSRHRQRSRKPPQASPAVDAPEKKVVRNGSTSEPKVQFSSPVSQQQAAQERQKIKQLLAISDANLKKMSGRQLNASQKDTVDQIRNYMEQAVAADKAGDIQRAQNLASKARLLSDDLVKH